MRNQTLLAPVSHLMSPFIMVLNDFGPLGRAYVETDGPKLTKPPSSKTEQSVFAGDRLIRGTRRHRTYARSPSFAARANRAWWVGGKKCQLESAPGNNRSRSFTLTNGSLAYTSREAEGESHRADYN
jgi:hypothetical protein